MDKSLVSDSNMASSKSVGSICVSIFCLLALNSRQTPSSAGFSDKHKLCSARPCQPPLANRKLLSQARRHVLQLCNLFRPTRGFATGLHCTSTNCARCLLRSEHLGAATPTREKMSVCYSLGRAYKLSGCLRYSRRSSYRPALSQRN